MSRTVGIFLTMTTYGKWLRGDARRWVDKGIVMPPNPVLENTDKARLKHHPFVFPRSQRFAAGKLIGQVVMELGGTVYALSVSAWHVHLLTGPLDIALPEVVKAIKDKTRRGLGYRRAIWAKGYDKRFCFDRKSFLQRAKYTQEHNLQDGLPANPWDFIVSL